jgi:predicted dehydrogenase
MSQGESSKTHREPTSIVAIGAGNRMRTYMHYVEEHPEEVKLVAVVDPDVIRRDQMAEQFNVPENHRFSHYTEFFKNPVEADAVIICTPDDEHYKPCMMAIRHGYHVLLEKPIAQTIGECREVARAAREAGVIVCVCHVLRYHPYFLKIKEIIDSGKLGQIISISHSEGVGIDRDTHSYVRGIWNKEKTSNPMLLAKCCHDVDFLLWLIGSPCKKVSSFGSLRWFRKEHAPIGSSDRCINCKVENTCPFSAVDLYWRRREWIRNFDVPANKTIDDVIKEELREGPHGRCVFHCDNDVVDHQTVLMEFENEVTATLSMDVFTLNDRRTTNINLTEGQIICDERKIYITHFRTQQQEVLNYDEVFNHHFHAGADLKIMGDFIGAIQGRDAHLPSLIDGAIESHVICLEAERSRKTGKTIHL